MAVDLAPIKVELGRDGVWRLWPAGGRYPHDRRAECRDLTVLVCWAWEVWPGSRIEVRQFAGRAACGSCRTGEHMCGGGCDCTCLAAEAARLEGW
jgi:hypothetical protein